MIGYFDNGVFSKRSRSSFSNSEIENGIKFKVTTKNNKNRCHIKNKLSHNLKAN